VDDGRIVTGVSASVRVPEPATRAFAVVGAGIVVLILIDVVVGVRVFEEVRPALTADVFVAFALSFAMLEPRRLLLAATIGGAVGSIAVSRAVEMYGPLHFNVVMGSGAWPGFAEVAGLGFLAAWCVREARLPGAIAALTAVATAFAAIIVLRQNGPYDSELVLLFGTAWLAIAVAGFYLRVLDERQEELALRARQDERISIARDLHDMVAHHVTGIVVQAQAARLVAADRPEAAAVALERIERAGAEALGAMRLMVGALRDETAPADLAPAASLDDLRAIGKPPARGELPVKVSVDDRAEGLAAEVVASLHRIAREAVTNARRHAVGASSIVVDIRCRDGHVVLLVRNDGAQSNPAVGGFGLQGMAERAEALGGTFSAGPLPAGGWQVIAELPVETTVGGTS
jgi:signal transduction histidine kinase